MVLHLGSQHEAKGKVYCCLRSESWSIVSLLIHHSLFLANKQLITSKVLESAVSFEL